MSDAHLHVACVNFVLICLWLNREEATARDIRKQDQRAPCGRSHDARPAACPRPTVVFRSILCGAAESPNHGPHMQYWFRRIFAYSKDFAAKLGCRKPAFGSDASRVGLYGVSFAVRTANNFWAVEDFDYSWERVINFWHVTIHWTADPTWPDSPAIMKNVTRIAPHQ